MQTAATRLAAIFGILVLALGLIAGCVQGAKTESPEEFYKGKTVTVIISSDAGSGPDTLVRAMSPYLTKVLGATVKVENMGSEEGLNWVYDQAKRDGLTMVVKQGDAIVSNDILKAPGVLYEAEKFNYLTDIRPGGVVFEVSSKVAYKTPDDLRKAKGLKGGATSAKGYLATSSSVMSEILGLDAKVITGYNRQGLSLALGSGEVDFMVINDDGAMRDEAAGYVLNIFAVTKERSRVVPNVPTMFELGVQVPKENDTIYKYITSPGYAAAFPPEVPQDRIDYMRSAFQKVDAIDEVHQDIQKIMGVPPTPFMPGKELQDRVTTMKADKDLVGQLDRVLTKYKATK
ncbi:MAG: hypothetical protein HYY30_11980 [Chloroflexi bacterium]|nr:hypothetical protein [Chloroflexota bacterium]